MFLNYKLRKYILPYPGDKSKRAASSVWICSRRVHSFHNFSRYCPQNNFIQNSWLYNFELKSDVMIFFWLVCCAVHKNIFHNLVYFLMLLCFVLKMMTEKFFFSNFVRRREMETAKTLIGYIVSIICIIW